MNIDRPNKIRNAHIDIKNLLAAGIISRRQAKAIAQKAKSAVSEAMEYWGNINEDWMDILNETYRELAKI